MAGRLNVPDRLAAASWINLRSSGGQMSAVSRGHVLVASGRQRRGNHRRLSSSGDLCRGAADIWAPISAAQMSGSRYKTRPIYQSERTENRLIISSDQRKLLASLERSVAVSASSNQRRRLGQMIYRVCVRELSGPLGRRVVSGGQRLLGAAR